MFGQIYGDFTDISNGHPSIFAYIRRLGTSKALVLLNFKDQKADFVLGDMSEETELPKTMRLVLGNYGDEERRIDAGTIRLREYESQVYLSE